jgi:hypothetical protein
MEEEVLVVMPNSPAPPPLPPHTIQSFVHVEHLTGVRRGEICWMPNLVEMADGVTPPVLQNPESVLWYDGLHEAMYSHASDTRRQHTMAFSSNC